MENILPETRFSRPAAFVDLETVVGIEDFRDGFQTDVFPAMSGQVREQARETFARARIYAKQLDDVALLALKLRAKISIHAQKLKPLKMSKRLMPF